MLKTLRHRDYAEVSCHRGGARATLGWSWGESGKVYAERYRGCAEIKILRRAKTRADCASDCISRALREHTKCRLLVVRRTMDSYLLAVFNVSSCSQQSQNESNNSSTRPNQKKGGYWGYENHPTRFYLPRMQA